MQLATTSLRKTIPHSGRELHYSIETVIIVETGMAANSGCFSKRLIKKARL